MHAINDMLVLMVLRGQAEATKKQYAGVLRQRAREREGESRRGLSVIAAATAAHAIRSLSAPLSSSPRARRLRFHVPIYMYLIYNHAFFL